MGFRDRFFTPRTAKAILSWRLLLGVGVGVVVAVVGVPWWLAGVAGLVVYAGSVMVSMPKPATAPEIDPFTLSEPWRQLVQQAQQAGRRLSETVSAVADGPLKEHLREIADQLEKGLHEAYRIAQRGDQLDAAIVRLDPVGLRSKLATLEQRGGPDPAPDVSAAIDSVKSQLASADRLKSRSTEVVDQLRLSQTRLDELVARTAEVAVGTAEADTYAHDVDDLVLQLEALHQAIRETSTPSPGTGPGAGTTPS